VTEGLSPESQERMHQALAHFQTAALELIDAARAVLDVAEEAARDPSGLLSIVAETAGGLATALGEVSPSWRTRSAGAGDHEPDRGGVEHIRIS
jgi:hypothetical protein